jgi:hypothetical protein
MTDDAQTDTVSLAAWLAELHRIMGAEAGPSISEEEQTALLDIARMAAHGSERIAAPLSTFLAGVAFGRLPPVERAAALRALTERLEG